MGNLNGDLLDEGLQAVMGRDRCRNDWQKKDTPQEGQWEPVKARNWMDRLAGCVKDTFPFGVLSCLFFYWQQTQQMLPSAAMPCICACMVLAGIGIGRNLAGGGR